MSYKTMTYNTQGIREEYYDMKTARIMRGYMSPIDKETVKRCDLDEYELLLSRWKLLVVNMSRNYRREYYTQKTQTERNRWLRLFLSMCIEKGVNELPLSLLPYL
jgi:hypothetical protein